MRLAVEVSCFSCCNRILVIALVFWMRHLKAELWGFAIVFLFVNFDLRACGCCWRSLLMCNLLERLFFFWIDNLLEGLTRKMKEWFHLECGFFPGVQSEEYGVHCWGCCFYRTLNKGLISWTALLYTQNLFSSLWLTPMLGNMEKHEKWKILK